MNIRSLPKHYDDVMADYVLMNSDFICLTETHLKESSIPIAVPEFTAISAIAGKGKGVTILAKNHYPVPNKTFIEIQSNYQIIILIYDFSQICCVYRSSSSRSTLTDIFDYLYEHMDFEKSLIISGDLNIDHKKYPQQTLARKLAYSNLYQIVHYPTHREGNIIDHVYCHENDIVRYFLHPVYYSDHDAVCATVSIE